MHYNEPMMFPFLQQPSCATLKLKVLIARREGIEVVDVVKVFLPSNTYHVLELSLDQVSYTQYIPWMQQVALWICYILPSGCMPI